MSNPAVVKVHNECRKNYTSKRRLEQFLKRPRNDSESETLQAKSLRSCSTFDWKLQYFLCGKRCVEGDRHRDRSDRRSVKTMEIQKNVLDVCAKRLSLCASDVAALSVQSCLMTCCDLVAEETVYHRKCHTDFFASSVVEQVGRPVDVGKYEAFDKLCEKIFTDTAGSAMMDTPGKN